MTNIRPGIVYGASVTFPSTPDHSNYKRFITLTETDAASRTNLANMRTTKTRRIGTMDRRIVDRIWPLCVYASPTSPGELPAVVECARIYRLSIGQYIKEYAHTNNELWWELTSRRQTLLSAQLPSRLDSLVRRLPPNNHGIARGDVIVLDVDGPGIVRVVVSNTTVNSRSTSVLTVPMLRLDADAFDTDSFATVSLSEGATEARYRAIHTHAASIEPKYVQWTSISSLNVDSTDLVVFYLLGAIPTEVGP